MDEQTKATHREWTEKYPDLVIKSDVLAKYLIEAGVIGPNTTRCVIDLEVGQPIHIYTERFGAASLLNVGWIEALKASRAAIEQMEAPDEAQHAHPD